MTTTNFIYESYYKLRTENINFKIVYSRIKEKET